MKHLKYVSIIFLITVLLKRIKFTRSTEISIFPFSYDPNSSISTTINYARNDNQSTTINKSTRSCQAASYCDDMEACSSHGMCYVDLFSYYNITLSNKKTRCICNIGWKSIDGHHVRCCYQKKQQAIAFLLEFVVGFGTGHWYIGNRAVSMIKMIFSAMLCVVIWFTCFFTLYKKGDLELTGREKKEKKTNVHGWIMISCICLFYLWQIIDAILFGINYYVDGKGHELQEW